MLDYRWDRTPVPPLENRYPDTHPWPIWGREEWRAGAQQFPFRTPTQAYRWLDELRQLRPPAPHTVCPRVFVSHKQLDAGWARRIARLANRQGFDFWLDVLDLDPSVNAQ